MRHVLVSAKRHRATSTTCAALSTENRSAFRTPIEIFIIAVSKRVKARNSSVNSLTQPAANSNVSFTNGHSLRAGGCGNLRVCFANDLYKPFARRALQHRA